MRGGRTELVARETIGTDYVAEGLVKGTKRKKARRRTEGAAAGLTGRSQYQWLAALSEGDGQAPGVMYKR